MLRPITTSSASANAAPVAVQATTASNFAAQEGRASAIAATQSGQVQSGVGSADQTFRYNSFEFIYRQDIGRIVLVGQSPETGERVIQVPSEQALRAYERTARAERQLDRIQDAHGAAKQTRSASISAPQLPHALMAAVAGDNDGSGVVSVSA
jgi:hypothetical protein